MSEETPPPKVRSDYLTVQERYLLDLFCKQINEAFEHEDFFGCYLVGSALTTPHYRDVDIRAIFRDRAIVKMFYDTEGGGKNEKKLLNMNFVYSHFLSQMTGLKIDFQFAPQSSNSIEENKGKLRLALGI